MMSWKFYTNGSGEASAVSPGSSGSGKAIRVSLSSVGSNTQLMQSGIQLEPNTDYELSFNAYSNSGNDFKVTLAKHTAPYTEYGVNKSKINLTNSWEHYKINFATRNFESKIDDGRLYFWFAADAESNDQYYLDEVRLEKVSPNPPSSPSGLKLR